MDGERVHTAGKLGRERGIDHAVALNPVLPAKGFRYDIKSEMGLAAGPVSGMTFVPTGFVFDVQALRRESLVQLFCDEIARLHGAL